MFLIKTEKLSHTYMSGSPFKVEALKNINLKIKEGEIVGIIGPTGSGKSTLIQHFNGLLTPGAGKVFVLGRDIFDKKTDLKAVRRDIGLVFQYPEHQLFEETVYADIAFGPRNLGIEESEIDQRVKRAMDFVGLDYEKFANRTPFQLSGGQMRRVAIAGVIALEPRYLILDEPSAGLDPQGRDEIFGQIIKMYQATGITVVLVSHNMEDIARMANRLIVMNAGEGMLDGLPADIFRDCQEQLQQAGVDVPPLTVLMNKFKQRDLPVDHTVVTMDAAVDTVLTAVRRS